MSRTHVNKFIEEVCSWYSVWYDSEDNNEDGNDIDPQELVEIWEEAQENDENVVNFFLDEISKRYSLNFQEIHELWSNTKDTPIENMVEELTSNICPEWLSVGEDLEDFLERPDVLTFVQSKLGGIQIRNLRIERLYNAVVRHKLSENEARYSQDPKDSIRRQKKASIYLYRQFGVLKRGFLEIRGNCHIHQSDEENLYYLPEKFSSILDENERTSVILCGRITDFSRDLLNKTKHYLQYLDGNIYPFEYRRLFEFWSSCQFGGYHSFDDIFGHQNEEENEEENE